MFLNNFYWRPHSKVVPLTKYPINFFYGKEGQSLTILEISVLIAIDDIGVVCPAARILLKCDGTRAETRFRLSAKRTTPFKSAGASVQSTTGSLSVRISGSNAGYTMFRGGVKGTGYPLHSPVLTCVCLSRRLLFKVASRIVTLTLRASVTLVCARITW
jgi:hypothetical protein